MKASASNQQHPVENIFTADKTSISLANNSPQFTIKLKSNPTTGYSWFLREFDKNLIIPIKHSFQAPTKNIMGASGYEFWTFKMKEKAFKIPVQTDLKFVYARPWANTDTTTAITFHISTQSNTH